MDQPDVLSSSAARSRIVERMHKAWRRLAEHVQYRGHHLLVPEVYRTKLSHTASSNPFLKKAGHDSRLFARFVRFLTGHAPIGEFRDRFKLDGPVDCLCGHPVESIQHIIWECPIWIRNWAPRSRILEVLESLDPFTNILWFLKYNPLVATFEYADVQEQAQEELGNGARDGFHCRIIRTLLERARVWNDTPGSDAQREAAVDAFDEEQQIN